MDDGKPKKGGKGSAGVTVNIEGDVKESQIQVGSPDSVQKRENQSGESNTSQDTIRWLGFIFDRKNLVFNLMTAIVGLVTISLGVLGWIKYCRPPHTESKTTVVLKIDPKQLEKIPERIGTRKVPPVPEKLLERQKDNDLSGPQRYEVVKSLTGRQLLRLGVAEAAKGELIKASSYFDMALERARQHGDRLLEGQCMANMGSVKMRLGEPNKSRRYLQDSIAIHDKLGKTLEIAHSRLELGQIYISQGDIEAGLREIKIACDKYENRLFKPGIVDCISLRGEHAYLSGDFGKALEYYQQALNKDRQLVNFTGEIQDLIALSSVYLKIGDASRSLESADKAIRMVRGNEAPSRLHEVIALNQLASIYSGTGSLEKALETAQEALGISRRIGFKSGECSALAYIGMIYARRGEPGKAQEYMKWALEISKETGDKRQEADSLQAMAALLKSVGDLDESLQYAKRSLYLFRQLGCKHCELLPLHHMANAFMAKGQFEKALDIFNKGLVICRKLRYTSIEAAYLGNIGIIHAGFGRHEKAQQAFEKSIALEEQTGDSVGVMTGLINLGDVLRKAGKYDEALKHFERSLRIAKSHKAASGEAAALRHIGLLYKDVAKYESALEYLRQALDLDVRTGEKIYEIGDVANIGITYGEMGKYSEALDYLRRALKMSDKTGIHFYRDIIRGRLQEFEHKQKALHR
jgi:tetratricopeptide (TPR) repeat protein